MRFLITAGPTREYIDAVRFVSNASSGRMGYAVAEAAAARGHAVVLISGPTCLPDPPKATVIRVETTEEMYRAADRYFTKVDCLVGAAAPADFQPARRVKGKIKKSGAERTLRLKPTTDVLATLGRRKDDHVVIAFAVEVQSPTSNALAKLRRKNADAVVLNGPEAMSADKATVTILLKDGKRIKMSQASKARIAERIVKVVESLAPEKERPRRARG